MSCCSKTKNISGFGILYFGYLRGLSRSSLGTGASGLSLSTGGAGNALFSLRTGGADGYNEI